MGCGKVSVTKEQARFSVQKIDDIVETVIPYFNKNKLAEKKKKDFELWRKAVVIIHKNKGKYLSKWEKSDLLSVIKIKKSMVKYKNTSKQPKWIQMAKNLANYLPNLRLRLSNSCRAKSKSCSVKSGQSFGEKYSSE